MHKKWTCVLAILGCQLFAGAAAAADPLDSYNVVWDTPSENAHGSMPLGNGDVGINAWVEPSGDLVFYVSKTDAWDENAGLCKIGRVRVKFDPPLAPKDGFRQELKLRDGVVQIESEVRNQPAKILIVGGRRPAGGPRGGGIGGAGQLSGGGGIVALRELPMSSMDDYGYGGGKDTKVGAYREMKTLPDVVATSTAPRVVWYHRNTRSLYPVCLDVQHLETLKGRFADPLLNRTFGASLRGGDMVQDGAKALKSSRLAKRHELSVCVLAERAETPDAWLKDLDRAERAALQFGFDQSRLTTAKWWQAFWNRSWVFVDGKARAGNGNAAAPPLTQGYVLQRVHECLFWPRWFADQIQRLDLHRGEASRGHRRKRPKGTPIGGAGAAATGSRIRGCLLADAGLGRF